jgi:hypothetical protein
MRTSARVAHFVILWHSLWHGMLVGLLQFYMVHDTTDHTVRLAQAADGILQHRIRCRLHHATVGERHDLRPTAGSQ